MRIHQLPPHIANQIAAGEVIERPASVVKELLENSLDAGARSIHIAVDYGGVNRIKISDDGAGIVADDLPLAVSAHATSKISSLNDLYQIASMGFRGEALASIASVSRLTITSKAKGENEAATLKVNASGPIMIPAARAQGTTVDVQDLFYNAPVRKKFLKSSHTEYLAIESVVRRFAMCQTDISITLTHNGKQTLILPMALSEKTRAERIKKILGKPFLEQAIFMSVDRSQMRLEGWIGGGDYHRSQNDKLWIYVNQRMVKDKLLNHAVKQSYERFLPAGRYPGCLLYLTLPTQEVDVNVHPTKHEVRFQQPRLVHDLIVSELTKVLSNVNQAEVNAEYIERSEPLKSLAVHENYVSQNLVSQRAYIAHQKKIMMLNSSFAILFYHDESFLVDIQALYTMGLLHELKKQDFPLTKRPLLVPITIQVPPEADELLNQHQKQLWRLGIEIDRVSDADLIVRSIPAMLPQLDINQFLAQLLKSSYSSAHELLPLLAACHSIPSDRLDEEAQTQLASYFAKLLPEANKVQNWFKRLDAVICREILDD